MVDAEVNDAVARIDQPLGAAAAASRIDVGLPPAPVGKNALEVEKTVAADRFARRDTAEIAAGSPASPLGFALVEIPLGQASRAPDFLDRADETLDVRDPLRPRPSAKVGGMSRQSNTDNESDGAGNAPNIRTYQGRS